MVSVPTVPNPFKKSEPDVEASPAVADAPAAEQNPALSAFLSPTSRIFGAKGLFGGGANSSSTKQLQPEEIAQKIASLLRAGPPFYSAVDNATLLANLGDASIMNADGLREQAKKNAEKRAKIPAKKQTKTADTANAVTVDGAAANDARDALPTSGADANTQADTTWTGVGTVWAHLNALPVGDNWAQVPSLDGNAVVATSGPQDDGLWNSMMVTCDLKGSKVNLAKSVVLPTQVLQKHHYFAGNANAIYQDIKIGKDGEYDWDDFQAPSTYSNLSYFGLQSFNPTVDMWSLPSWVPFFGKKTGNEGASAPALPDAGNDANGQKRVWVPSETEVSVHCSWWGYQVYLPPPVMAELQGDVAQAEKIAQTISSVLTVIANHVPTNLPLALLPFAAVLKAIAPISGYASTFIGWSWDEIKSFDKGNGVQLAATWILPIALIPHSWEAATTPAPAPAPTPAPANPAPAPADPVPAAPAPATPTPADPVPAAPAPAEPVPAAPTPAEPTPAAPTPAVPTPAAPTPAEPAPAAPAPAEPAPTEPTPAEPAVPAVPTTKQPAESDAPVEKEPAVPTLPAKDVLEAKAAEIQEAAVAKFNEISEAVAPKAAQVKEAAAAKVAEVAEAIEAKAAEIAEAVSEQKTEVKKAKK